MEPIHISLETFYKQLEDLNDYNHPLLKLPDYSNLPDHQKMNVSIEVNAQTILSKDHISETFKGRESLVQEYLTKRINQTKNPYLKAKYLQFLFILNPNQDFLKESYNYHSNLLENLPINNLDEHFSNFEYLLEECINISKQIKFDKENLKAKIHSYLRNPMVSSIMKCRIVKLISTTDYFAAVEINYIPFLCYEIAQVVNEDNWIENALELARFFVAKFPDQKVVKNEIMELSGDFEMKKADNISNDSRNIVIPHQKHTHYENAIKYYNNTSNSGKLLKAKITYENNKKYLKFLPFLAKTEEHTIDKINDMVDSLVNETNKLPATQLILKLGLGVINMPEDFFKSQIKNLATKNSYQKLFKDKVADINLNFQDYDGLRLQEQRIYEEYMERIVGINFLIIEKAVKEKKLSFRRLIAVLKKNTFFGVPLIVNGDNTKSYNWLSLIESGLQSFFKELCSFLSHGKYTWQTSITLLTINFEGILRDIVQLSDGDIVKLDKQQNIKTYLLEDLLNNDVLKQTFSPEDLMLFKFTFTNKGLNIRNNVAHAFYRPFNYTIDKAILVLLCTLRLVKFTGKRI